MNTSGNLTTELPRQSSWVLAPHFLRLSVLAFLRQSAHAFGLRRAASITAQAITIPDSAVARKAFTVVEEVSPKFLLNHGLRTFGFGCALGLRDGLVFDREAFFLAAVMHDLGLTTTFDGQRPFEIEGAAAAHDFLLREGVDAKRAELIHEAIALHARMERALKGSTELKLVHLGAGLDIIGIRNYDLTADAYAKVNSTWPRDGFKQGFTALLNDQAQRKPHCNIAGHVSLGLCGRILAMPFND